MEITIEETSLTEITELLTVGESKDNTYNIQKYIDINGCKSNANISVEICV